MRVRVTAKVDTDVAPELISQALLELAPALGGERLLAWATRRALANIDAKLGHR